MAFTNNPDHIFSPKRGWLKGGLPIENGIIDGAGYRMQTDCSTGLVGYTLITPKEIIARNQEIAADQALQAIELTAQESDTATMQQEAAVNPAFAALLRRLGVT